MMIRLTVMIRLLERGISQRVEPEWKKGALKKMDSVYDLWWTVAVPII